MRMLRAIVVATLVGGGCGGAKSTKIEGPPPPVGAAVPLPPAAGSDASSSGFKPGPGGFPVPSDADAGQAVGVDNTGYNIPRPKDAVYAQLRPEIEKQGFTVDKYIAQANSHRMIIYKDRLKYIASVTYTDDKSCTLFVTVSPTDK